MYKEYMTSPIKMASKYSGTCNECKSAVAVGDMVLWTKGTKGVKHASCPKTTFVSFEVNGETLRNRIATLEAKLVEQEFIRQDFFAEFGAHDADKVEVCPECNGRGFKTIKWDSSETLDSRSIEHTNVRCGSKAEIMTSPSVSGWNSRFEGVEINGVKAEEALVACGPHTYTVYGGVNQTCQTNFAENAAWQIKRARAEAELVNKLPHFHETEAEIALCKKELEIRKGDIATVINRGKKYTGKVVFVGRGEDFSRPYGNYRNSIPRTMPIRVSIVTADGKKYGGAVETAEFVSRTTNSIEAY